MELIKPSYQVYLDAEPEQILGNVERAGRVCYKSEGKITPSSSTEFVKRIIKNGHESVLEHEKVTVRIICDRGVSHELVRHRIASYSQESTRYCDYGGGHIKFVIPPWASDIEPGTYVTGRSGPGVAYPSFMWFSAMASAEETYKDLRSSGWSPQQARSVLPNSLKTEIVMTCNLREWRHFFKLRTSLAAHPQMREIVIPLLETFRDLIPVVFDDLDITD